MAQVIQSLEEISTSYCVFEKDQVLTEGQLNGVSRYFEDQTRLSRVDLIGVGIACGLKPRLDGDAVVISKGVGVTTDGDLVLLAADTRYTDFKPYGDPAPVYDPFVIDGTPITAQILIPESDDDATASPLSQFAGTLANMSVVLFVESSVKDDDLCSGTDCDNLGQTQINPLKVLLVDAATTAALRAQLEAKLQSPAQVAQSLPTIVVDRPVFNTNVTSYATIASGYRASCNSTHTAVLAALTALWAEGEFFLDDVFDSSPVPGWQQKLNSLKTEFASEDTGIQYYYDLLKDVAETHNALVDLLFDENTVCCPDIEAFPKHLVLGGFGSDKDPNRTDFYPSPATARPPRPLAHAKFLARKIDALLKGFTIPSATSLAVRITPSRTEVASLEDRAIPYYYKANSNPPVHERWSFARTRRNQARWNYGYHASAYNAEGGAANPFGSQIGRFDFFRIEGHLGRSVTDVVNSLKSQIKAKDLSFDVQAILLGGSSGQVAVWPPVHYGPFYQFHHELRAEVAYQYGEVIQYAGDLKKKVDQAVTQNVVPKAQSKMVSDAAKQMEKDVATNAAHVQAKLAKPYTEYRQDTSWQTDAKNTIMAAGESRQILGDYMKTDLMSPFDYAVGPSYLPFLDIVDKVIQGIEQKTVDGLLFRNFAPSHPGLEHFAGVTPGGTFVLVYDTANKVVADFMLPYRCCDPMEDEPAAEPPVKIPGVEAVPIPGYKPDWVFLEPIEVIPPWDIVMDEKLVDWEKKIKPEWDERFRNTVDLVGDLIGSRPSDTVVVGGGKWEGPLEINRRDLEIRQEKIFGLRSQLLEADDAARGPIEEQLKSAQSDLAKAIEDTVRAVATSGADVGRESTGFKALAGAAAAMATLTDTGVVRSLRTRLGELGRQAAAPQAQLIIGNMTK